MKILGYGEDALTLWAIKNKLSTILNLLNDSSSPSNCKIFFRPSFGRSGGAESSQFGEFDFILLSEKQLYLGESKWSRSSEKIAGGILDLRKEQVLRHTIFKFYVQEWAFGNYSSWHDFEELAVAKLQNQRINKPIAPSGSLLVINLKTVLEIIQQHFKILPPIRNVLLFLHSGSPDNLLPKSAGTDFEVVCVDYSDGVIENFVEL